MTAVIKKPTPYVYMLARKRIIVPVLSVIICVIIFNTFRYNSVRRSGVCIFDLSAVMIGDRKVAPYALEAQNKCIRYNHDIALFSPYLIEPDKGHVEFFLTSNFPHIWTPTKIKSPAFQIDSKISPVNALQLVLNHYQKDSSCSVLISNHFEIEKFTEKLGFHFADIHEGGVTAEQMNIALSSLERTCNPALELPEEFLCSDISPDEKFTCSRQKKWGKCRESWMAGYCCYSCFGCQCPYSVNGLNSTASKAVYNANSAVVTKAAADYGTEGAKPDYKDGVEHKVKFDVGPSIPAVKSTPLSTKAALVQISEKSIPTAQPMTSSSKASTKENINKGTKHFDGPSQPAGKSTFPPTNTRFAQINTKFAPTVQPIFSSAKAPSKDGNEDTNTKL